MDVKRDLKKINASEYVCGDFQIKKTKNLFSGHFSWEIFYKDRYLVNAYDMRGVRDYLQRKIDACLRSKQNS